MTTQTTLFGNVSSLVRPAIKINPEDARRAKLKSRVLNLLRAKGPRGATNVELNKIQFRYSATIHVLRKQGYKIRTKALGEGLFRYILEQDVS